MTVLGKGKPCEKDLLAIARHFNLSEKKSNDIINSINKVIES